MRSGTLGLFYFCKFVELIFLTIWTVLTIGSGVWLVQRIANSVDITSSEKQCLVLVPLCLLLAFFNLFYNNLLMNLRFKCKMNCVTIGTVIFDWVNFLFCYCILKKPCRDRCFTPWTLVKWFIKAALFGYTIYVVKQREGERMIEDEEAVIQYQEGDNNLSTYLIVYVLQHVIFIVARIPIFILYSILTCCCDKGRDYGDDEKFEDRVISFDFIEYELGLLNNFENHVVGLNELEYNRHLSVIRQAQRPVMEAQLEANLG